MIALIDNYDSFTYNLVHYLQEYEENIDVFRNDQLDLETLNSYSHIVISPGPGLPNEIPFLNAMFSKFSGNKKILGVCLGMQAMVEYYGGELYNLPSVLHGRQGNCFIEKDDPIVKSITSPFLIGHYHSWGVNDEGMPLKTSVIARDSENRIMMIKHDKDPTYGIQFHPESVLCPLGKSLLYNWLKET
jgi:anthranilate synthase component 2